MRRKGLYVPTAVDMAVLKGEHGMSHPWQVSFDWEFVHNQVYGPEFKAQKAEAKKQFAKLMKVLSTLNEMHEGVYELNVAYDKVNEYVGDMVWTDRVWAKVALECVWSKAI